MNKGGSMDMKKMTIGKLAKKAGISTDAVRFYERRGLIAEPDRTQSNYRVYPHEDVVRLRFIKRAKDLGFSLSEIKELLAMRHDPSASKADVTKRTEVKIRDIREKIADLSRILGALEHLDHSCDGHGPISDCPIIEALDDQYGEEPLHQHHGGAL
jgi:MerR family copper efflux transcriptional regulator